MLFGTTPCPFYVTCGPLVLECWNARIALGLIQMDPESQVPFMLASPDMEAKSQILSFKEIIKMWSIIIKVGSWLLYAKRITGLAHRGGLVFCSIQLSAHIPSLISKKCCRSNIHVILGTWYLRSRVKWKVPSSMLSTVEIARIDLKWLGT